MLQLHDRIALIESALQNLEEREIDPAPRGNPQSNPHDDPPARQRHSLDHRFDKTAIEVDAAPSPTPAQEKANPFDTAPSTALEPQPPSTKSPFYDSIAASFGLGIGNDDDEFADYLVYNAFVTNLRVCPVDLTDTEHYYYLEHRSFLPSVPGVNLRRGTDKTGKSVGVAHLALIGRNMFGVGDPDNDPGGMSWGSMANAGFWTHMRYAFEFELGDDGKTRKFCWIRTRNNLLDDQGDLVLVEEGREDFILAEYLGKGLLKWKKRGRLRIRKMQAFGERWELIVLLTWGSVVELSRRRARVRRYSPTHIISI
ncbi:hypothetical protein LOCC1_G001196 [Lachnellula occidentalis]|uniref:Uncharacterized protein n=1 Tax=Lachnellula occidentalis TaxID=215460 RepID=A0A8H8UJV2_9HELO|nr:hypothetical protein LOCC1_G001196 [Lachnellula occidentalis]